MAPWVFFYVKSLSSTLFIQSSRGTSVPGWEIANNLFDIPHKESSRSTKLYLFIYLFIYQERSVHIRTYPPAYSWNLGKGYFLYSWIQCYHFALYWCLCFYISFILYYFINGLQETLQWGDRREIDLSCKSAHTQAQGRWYWWQTVTEFASQKGRRLTLSF